MDPTTRCRGELHIFVAFDWGDEVDLIAAAKIAPARSSFFPKRPQTPSSISYRPSPLLFARPSMQIELPEIGSVAAETEVTVFDFAAISVALSIPFEVSPEGLSRLAEGLAHPQQIILAAKSAAEPLFEQLKPAIKSPRWSEISEEYFVFQLPPGQGLPNADALLASEAEWLASILQIDRTPFSREQVDEALRLRMTYGREDLVIFDWAAAILIDADGDDTLEIIEFANLQLLEFRQLDRRLDDELAAAYRLFHPLARSWLPVWRMHDQPLRVLGDLRIETHSILERTTSSLKLFSDQYLARTYRLISTRFHIDEWAHSISSSLEVVEGAYQVLADQSAMYRTELLEIIVIVLIAIEIVMALWGGH